MSNAHVIDFATLAQQIRPEPGSAPAPKVDPEPQPAARKPKAKPVELKPADVIKLARKRLREVRRELKRLDKLRAEENQLTRLLNAADKKN